MASSNVGEGEFWVYENYPTNRARLHRGDCIFCNHGKGVSGRGGSKNVHWHGPFATLKAACDKLNELGKKDSGVCYYCNPCQE